MSRTMSDQQAAEIEWSLLEQPSLAIAAAAPRVLLIDADADAVLVLTALLVPEHQVCVAGSRAAALSLLQQERYALVVLDPAVPDSANGADSEDSADSTDSAAPDLLALVQQYQASAALLLYSAQAPHTIAGARGLAYLAKPWSTPRQLWHAITELLEQAAMAADGAYTGKDNPALV